MARRRRHRLAAPEDTGETLLSYEFLVRIPHSGWTASTARWRCHAKPHNRAARASALWICQQKRDLATYLLAFQKIRLDSVKRMSQIQNTS